ncbi:virulence RhuM family protein [Arthrobacter sp. VKM Ac-2550]|uniref:virulence RhuM family protein n=1 Tax=Crystallibacter permensis TaxID=1938888 RepID=UPI0022265726|nr:virulence RhuM family protein [Arthrobacter sp. VKM Ac-2550]MCW2134265.1 hypothetical protein [Arthrobacter sp. VKM Ac-2550]
MAESEAPAGDIVVYVRGDAVRLDVRFDGDTVWLSQAQIAELFGTTQQNVSLHITNIINEGELDPDSTHKDYLLVRREGSRSVRRAVAHYNLDMIISVGYRVQSKTATLFRIWATQQLREYIVKGFVLDDERLKNPDRPFDYFDELLQRIQDIRTSERRFYQKITDIYALSTDYDPTDPHSIDFFATVQNKLHWAITGNTAAELIHARARADEANMGLTTWRGSMPRKSDATIAKNYLTEQELADLNNLVEQFLVFAEGQARRKVSMKMADWISKLEAFLTLNDRESLKHAGKISRHLAEDTARSAYDEFHRRRVASQDMAQSDFDEFVARTIRNDGPSAPSPTIAKQPSPAPAFDPAEEAPSSTFDSADLRRRGFTGFLSLGNLDLQRVPVSPGLYAVLSNDPERLAAAPKNVGGWFKRKDPTDDVEKLSRRLSLHVPLLYIGKADAGSKGNRGLRARINEFVRFGNGEPVGHWGGRYLWQLVNPQELVLAWLPIDSGPASSLESAMLEEFYNLYGQLPFANLRR